MFNNFIFWSLMLILSLNVFSYYNAFILNVEILILLIFIFVIFMLFQWSIKFVQWFLIEQKNIIFLEYYNKFFDFFYFLDIYYLFLIAYFQQMCFSIFLVKSIKNIFKTCLVNFITNFKHFLTYLVINFFFILNLNKQLITTLRLQKLFHVAVLKFWLLSFYKNFSNNNVFKWLWILKV